MTATFLGMDITIWNTFFWIPLMLVNYYLYCYQKLFSITAGKEGGYFESHVSCDFKSIILTVEWISSVSFCPYSNNSLLCWLLTSSPTLSSDTLGRTKTPWGSTCPRISQKPCCIPLTSEMVSLWACSLHLYRLLWLLPEMTFTASNGFQPERMLQSLLSPHRRSLSENGANIKEQGPGTRRQTRSWWHYLRFSVHLCLKIDLPTKLSSYMDQ